MSMTLPKYFTLAVVVPWQLLFHFFFWAHGDNNAPVKMLLMTTVARKEQRKWSFLQRSNLGLPHFLPPTHGAPSIMSEVPEEGLNPKFQLLVCGTVWRTGWVVHIPSSLSRVERTYWLTLVDYTFLGLCVFTEASLKVSMYTTKGSLPAWWFHMQNAHCHSLWFFGC